MSAQSEMASVAKSARAAPNQATIVRLWLRHPRDAETQASRFRAHTHVCPEFSRVRSAPSLPLLHTTKLPEHGDAQRAPLEDRPHQKIRFSPTLPNQHADAGMAVICGQRQVLLRRCIQQLPQPARRSCALIRNYNDGAVQSIWNQYAGRFLSQPAVLESPASDDALMTGSGGLSCKRAESRCDRRSPRPSRFNR
jgi:hypothetical protein